MPSMCGDGEQERSGASNRIEPPMMADYLKMWQRTFHWGRNLWANTDEPDDLVTRKGPWNMK